MMKAEITLFLGRTGGRNSSLWYHRPRHPRPSSSTSTQRVARYLLLLAALLILVVASSNAQTKSQNSASLIYERCHSSVVVVVPLDKDNKPLGQGSGFIIATNQVVTNHHVLADATSAAVSFADGGTEVVEGFIADNPARDITIVSVNTGTRAPLKLGDELSLKQGDEVYAIGAPRGLDLSITNGIVSGFRSIKDQFLIQTTAAIAPGSSGGPLFDKDGGVIGVTTSLLADSPGIYFSVGIGDVARIMRSASTIVLPISSLPGSGKVNENATEPPAKDEIPTTAEYMNRLMEPENYKVLNGLIAGLTPAGHSHFTIIIGKPHVMVAMAQPTEDGQSRYFVLAEGIKGRSFPQYMIIPLEEIDPSSVRAEPGLFNADAFEKFQKQHPNCDTAGQPCFRQFFVPFLDSESSKWWCVSFQTTSMGRLIQRGELNQDCSKAVESGCPLIPTPIDSVAKTFLVFKNRDSAERVVNALAHAIKLSGGQADPFAPTTSREVK